jgi:hypothetical protein
MRPVFTYDVGVPLEALVRDAREATREWDWRRGAYGHALSLPRAEELHPSARYRYPNTPCTGRLDACPALRTVFDSFHCDKVSFRLLRRAAHSAYGWHTDEWKGPNVVRFQIPIVSDATSFLVTTDYRVVEEIRGDRSTLTPGHFNDFARANAGHVARHELTPGRLHYFDTTFVHTLVNGGAAERLTLSFDLVANDWLRARFPDIAGEIGDAARPGPLRPGHVRLAADWVRARFHPLRTRFIERSDRSGRGPS